MPIPRLKAAAVLDELRINDVRDLSQVEDIAWARGALVRFAPIAGAEARLVVYGTQGIITISDSVTHPQRRRFGVAHELGHFEIHKEESGLSVCTADDIERPRFGSARDHAARREAEANEFASHLLIPDRFLEPMIKGRPPTLDLISELADVFDVSLTASAIAYMRVCTEACAVVYSKDNQARWFVRSKDMEDYGLFIEMGPLDPYTIASAFFRGRPVQSRPGRVDAASWFAPGRFREGGTIKEHSVGMPNYGSTLSLLWVDQDIVY